MSPDEIPTNEPTQPPADPPKPDPVEPPPPPPTPVPDPPKGDGTDRLDKLETTLGNLVETVADLVGKIAPSGDEVQPQKKPWTHWGSK